jgi:outer membrane protein assembly factor BamB
VRGASRWLAVTQLALLASASAASGQESWPQWRGPTRDGRAEALTLRDSWPAELQRVWRVPVGEGHASPVSDGEHVYVFCRSGEAEQAMRLDLDDGTLRWSRGYPAPYEAHPAARAHGKGPKATPVLASGRLYTLGIDGMLSCFDADSGALAWQQGFGSEFPRTSPIYGAAASPIANGDVLIAAVGGPGEGAVVAIELASGARRWTWRGEGPGYASPVAVTLEGVAQVITLTESRVVGLAMGDGRLLWSAPLRTPYDQNAVTPLVSGEIVIYSGLDQGIRAVRPRHGTEGWSLDPVWSVEAASLYMSSPVLSDGALYGFSHKRHGQYFALDAASGAVLWTSPGRQAENAALLAGRGMWMALTDGAELMLAEASRDDFAPVATYGVADGATWAHPVPVPGGVLVKDTDTLALWTLP